LGNICRSPTAEGVTRHLAGLDAAHVGLELDSAGTAGYHIGAPPDARSQRAAAKRGIDLSGLRARKVARDDFERFDLILAMDRTNLRDLGRLAPMGARAEVRLFLDYAPACADRDIPDPYYGDALGFERVLDLSETAARGLLASLQKRS